MGVAGDLDSTKLSTADCLSSLYYKTAWQVQLVKVYSYQTHVVSTYCGINSHRGISTFVLFLKFCEIIFYMMMYQPIYLEH